MSNKSKTVKADKTTAQGLVPKLRFPEFQDAGTWEEKPLGKVYSFKVTNSFSRDKLNYEKGSVKNIHYGDIHTKFSILFDIRKEIVPFINSSEAIGKIKSDNYCIEGDMVFADASEDLNDVGKSIEIVNLNNEKLLSGLHTLLARQKKSELVIGFGGYLFKSNGIRAGIKKEAQGAKVLGVSATRLSNINIYFPTDKKEQQKIADCLSSIDELINGQAQKIDTLKAHKKGLMQQLFPAEGETVPKLRFPEFRDAVAWKGKPLGKVAKIITGNTPKTAESNNYGGNRLFVSPADISDQRYISTTKTTLSDQGFEKTRPIKAKSILFVCIGSTIGKVAQNKFECATNQQINSVVPFNEYSNDFIYSFLEKNSGQIAVMAGKQAVPIINKTLFSSVIFSYPSLPEQQKIADCLSSIDELLAAQAQKLDTLKTHKKGLMQQLFPSTDEVNG